MSQHNDWKNEVASILKSAVSSVENVVDERWQEMKLRMGWDGKARIQPYIGMANDNNLWLSGRILTNPIPTPPAEDDAWWDKLLASWQRWESDEMPGVEVELTSGDLQTTTTSDDEGYFHFELDLREPFAQSPWQTVQLKIVGDHPPNASREPVAARIRTVKLPLSYGVISDMDDTVIHSGMTGFDSHLTKSFSCFIPA